MIYVTHDQAEAVSLCDRLAVMNFGELQQIGTVDEIWNKPANKFVATFVGEPQMNFMNAKMETPREVSMPAKQGKMTFQCARQVDQRYVGSEIIMGVRPHEITLSLSKEGETPLGGSVELIEFHGEVAILTVNLESFADTAVRVLVPGERSREIGESVWLGFSPEIIHLFDGESTISRETE
jgi:ABC-type sugar transport system ATPase subunit